jgi:hypothetical protein
MVKHDMVIGGIRITIQSEDINSPPNKDKFPITIMKIALKQYSGFNLPQSMRETRWIWEMEMVLMEMPPHMPRRAGDDGGFDFPLSGGLGAAGSALSRRRRGLLPFVATSIEWRVEATLEAQMGLGGVA